MVTETLKDILQSVVNEEKQETQVFDKYMQWCETETGNIAKDLAESRSELESAKILTQE